MEGASTRFGERGSSAITLVVFTLIAFALLGSPLRWNYAVSYAMIVGAVFFAFKF